ncbi:MAG: U32 family peptidase [Gammaproteobacteria bacterium]|nr:U32 family peptidase [Gammaproteobacteria bacterium]
MIDHTKSSAAEPAPTIRLSLGPVLYYWDQERLLDFYTRIAETTVDIVYLGETVCSKRRTMRTEEWLELAEKLTAAGKQVVLSTLALIEAESELSTLRRLCNNGSFMVEANDMGAIQLLAGNGPFMTGHSVNLYNARALEYLAKQGLTRWVLPLELSRDTLADMQAQRPDGVETEVFVYGRMPLAYSARCFTARAFRLPKDDCQLRCLDHPDGMNLSTREGQPFLALNGIQTQSAQTLNLIQELPELARLKVDVVRINPQAFGTERVIDAFSAAIQGHPPPDLEKIMPVGPCNGYWYGKAGIAIS